MALDSLSEVQRRLSEAGFGEELVATGVGLRSTATGVEHDLKSLTVVEVARFEGPSDLDEEAAVVAVATEAGTPLGTFTTPYGPAASAEQAEVLRQLHRVDLPKDGVSGHDAHDHIAAIFANRAAAEGAIDNLRQVGLGSEHLGVAIHDTESVVFERDEDADMLHDVAVATGSGAVLGFLGGMLLFGLAAPGIGILGVGGIAAAGASTGLGGAMLGVYAGVGAAAEENEAHQRLRETKLAPDEVLVIVCGHGKDDLVEDTMRRHGGTLVPTNR